MNTFKLAAVSAFALALSATAGTAQVMEDFDGDADSMVTQDEFGAGLQERGVFGVFDADTDGMLNEEEYASYDSEGIIGDYDSDGDGMLSEDEYNAGVFGNYDSDASGDLNEEEFSLFEDEASEDGLFDF